MFSLPPVLHKAVVAWNMLQIEDIVGQIRGESNKIDDETLSYVTPLIRKHINPFGRYHFDLNRIQSLRGRWRWRRKSLTEVFGWMWLPPDLYPNTLFGRDLVYPR